MMLFRLPNEDRGYSSIFPSSLAYCPTQSHDDTLTYMERAMILDSPIRDMNDFSWLYQWWLMEYVVYNAVEIPKQLRRVKSSQPV